MTSRDDIVIEITPQVLLKAYSCGIFPMAEGADDPALYWIEPQHRGILPLDGVHVPRRLARTIRTAEFKVRINSDFEGVIDGCADSRPGRRSTWINSRIRELYRALHEQGHCHTVETWLDGRLVGGPLRRGARLRVLRREHVLDRARCEQGGARVSRRAPDPRRLHAARHPVRDRSPAPVRHRRSRPRRLPQAARAGAGAKPPSSSPCPSPRRRTRSWTSLPRPQPEHVQG